jgi:hypothetical protein
VFNKLKEKLSGFTKSLGRQIEEKSVPVEALQEQADDVPLISVFESSINLWLILRL